MNHRHLTLHALAGLATAMLTAHAAQADSTITSISPAWTSATTTPVTITIKGTGFSSTSRFYFAWTSGTTTGANTQNPDVVVQLSCTPSTSSTSRICVAPALSTTASFNPHPAAAPYVYSRRPLDLRANRGTYFSYTAPHPPPHPKSPPGSAYRGMPQPLLRNRTHIIQFANSDGTLRSKGDPYQASLAIALVNKVYAKAGIQFEFNGYTDFETVFDTQANLGDTIDNLNARGAAIPLGSVPTTEDYANSARANALLDMYRAGWESSHVLILARRPWHFVRNGAQWTFVPLVQEGAWAGGSTSVWTTGLSQYQGAYALTHELGHFYSLAHTQSSNPGEMGYALNYDQAVAQADAAIASGLEGWQAFDYDAGNVSDTPPDLTPDFWKSYLGAATYNDCAATLEAWIQPSQYWQIDPFGPGGLDNPANGTWVSPPEIHIAPDRANLMSYTVTSCRPLINGVTVWDNMSPDQITVMRNWNTAVRPYSLL